jgi:nucleoside-diphosphate-sugar epimerase
MLLEHFIKVLKNVILNKSVLVTGANGLLGCHVVKELLHVGGYDIHGLIRESSDNSLNRNIQSKVTWHKGDVTDIFSLEEAAKDIDVIIHTAGYVSYNPKKTKIIHAINVDGTANLCNVALALKTKKLVHISSIAALGKYENQDIIDEKSDWITSDFNTNYAISKYRGEMEVWRAITEGLDGTILNPSIILGCGHWNKSSLQFLPKLSKGGSVHPIGSTGFVDVIDVAKRAVMAIDSKYNSQRYIISGHNIPYKQFFDELTSRLGVKKAYLPMTPRLNSILWRIEYLRNLLTGRDPLITKQTANNSTLNTIFSNEKSLHDFELDYIPIEETLNRMVNCYLNEQK